MCVCEAVCPFVHCDVLALRIRTFFSEAKVDSQSNLCPSDVGDKSNGGEGCMYVRAVTLFDYLASVRYFFGGYCHTVRGRGVSRTTQTSLVSCNPHFPHCPRTSTATADIDHDHPRRRQCQTDSHEVFIDEPQMQWFEQQLAAHSKEDGWKVSKKRRNSMTGLFLETELARIAFTASSKKSMTDT